MEKAEISEGLAAQPHASSSKTGVNSAGTCSKDGTGLTQPCSGPVRYEVRDKDDGRRGSFTDKFEAAAWAETNIPGGQDTSGPKEEPNGWYLEIVR